MSNSDKAALSAQLAVLQHNLDAELVFNTLSELLRGRAQELIESDGCLPFEAWWRASCEFLAPRQVDIANVDFNGTKGKGEEDESIELVNSGPMILDLGNWQINAGDKGQDMTFPQGTLIKPGERLTINTRRKGEFSFNSPTSIWNNKGDTAYLFDNNNNAVSTYAYGNDAHEHVAIEHINFDGEEKRSEGDEFAEIRNQGNHWVALGDWQLSAGCGQNYDFPKDALLQPHSSIKVYTNRIDERSGGYSFASNTAVWNNKGDTGVLKDHKGDTVSQYSYGDKA